MARARNAYGSQASYDAISRNRIEEVFNIQFAVEVIWAMRMKRSYMTAFTQMVKVVFKYIRSFNSVFDVIANATAQFGRCKNRLSIQSKRVAVIFETDGHS